MTENVTVVIPAYNEEKIIVSVIRGLRARGFTHVIVVVSESARVTQTRLVNKEKGTAWSSAS